MSREIPEKMKTLTLKAPIFYFRWNGQKQNKLPKYIPEKNPKSYQWENMRENCVEITIFGSIVKFPSDFLIQFFKTVEFPCQFWIFVSNVPTAKN